jgi:outer membrane protein assembly factor BamB
LVQKGLIVHENTESYFRSCFNFLVRTFFLVMVFIAPGAVFLDAQGSAQFRGDPAHTGVYAGAAPKEITHVVWQFKTGGPVFSSPAIADGMVFVGSNSHLLFALDAASGREVWMFQTEANVNSSPAVAGGVVYVLSLDGNAYAVDEHSGKLKWKFQTGGESRLNMAGIYGLAPSREVVPDVWDFLLSSPTVDGGRVFFGSGDHNIYALDAATGKLVWKFQAPDVVHSSPAVANGVVYIGCWDGTLFALDEKLGQLKWQYRTGVDATHFMQGIPGSAAVADGTVVFGARDNFIYGLEAGTGKLLWKQENSGSWVIASAAIADGVVYIPTSDTMKLRALELKTGAQLFELPYKVYSFSSPALAGGHAYFGTFDGILHDADLTTRQMKAEFQVKAAADHKELLTAEGHLNEAAVYGPLGPDGKPNNTIDASIIGIDRLLQLGSILSSPVVANRMVYVGSADGSVYALN